MAFSDPSSRRKTLIPSFIYSSSSKTLPLHQILNSGAVSAAPSPSSFDVSSHDSRIVIPSPSEPGMIEMYSPAFYTACTAGGILNCGLTHMAVTPHSVVTQKPSFEI